MQKASKVLALLLSIGIMGMTNINLAANSSRVEIPKIAASASTDSLSKEKKEQLIPKKTSKSIIIKNNSEERKSAQKDYENKRAQEIKEQKAREAAERARKSQVSRGQTSRRDSTMEYTLKDLKFKGVIHWGGYKFTYYSQSVLPGGGLTIPGRHVNSNGYVADGDGYIVLANDAPRGTIINTPFGGPGKVYDRGTVGNHYDVYTE